MKKPEERLNFCLRWIESIRSDSQALTTNAVEALKYYNSEPFGTEQKNRSQYVTSDLADTIEWILPSLIRIFAGGDTVCELQPRGEEDVEAVKLADELANYQLRIRNKWFLIIHDWFKDALLFKRGVVKYQWFTEEKKYKKRYAGLTIEEIFVLMEDPSIEVVEQKPNDDGTWNITVEHKLQDEYPLVEAVPPEEVGFPKSARDIESCPFFFHKVKLYPYEIEKKYGKDKLTDVKDRMSSYSDGGLGDEELVTESRLADLGGLSFWVDEEDGKHWIYECYFTDPDTGEARRVDLCGDIILDDSENEYGKPPFHFITPIRMSHRIIGKSFHDLIKDLQRLRSALIRQILDNLYFGNSGRFIGDPNRVNLDDFLNNNIPGGFIRGDPTAIQQLQPSPIQPFTFKFLELVQTERESRAGVTRYGQGLNAQSLNRTARGVQAIMNQAQQRIELIARIFAEMGVGPLVTSVIDMNTKFMSKDTAIRVLNDWVEISPDNLVGQFDVIINVGVGTGNKDQIIAQMQQLLGIYAQIMQAGLPIATPENVYNACVELTKAMGYRNIQAFWTHPDVMEQMQGAMGGMMPPGMGMEDQGTMPGQNTPEQPDQPLQPLQPRTTMDGGGFYA